MSTLSLLRARELGGMRSGKVHGPFTNRLKMLRSYDQYTHKCWVGDTSSVPPFATSFCNRVMEGSLLAVADEEGLVTLLDTRKPFGNLDRDPDLASMSQNSSANSCTYEVHRNAIFDVLWLNDDEHFATVSGDATAKITSVRDGEATATLTGHSGSVKAIRAKPNHNHILATAGRDGHICIWDLRNHNNRTVKPFVTHGNPHSSCSTERRFKRPRLSESSRRPNSVTSLAFLNEHLLLSGGAVDGHVKVWDARFFNPYPLLSLSPAGSKQVMNFGVSSIDVDPTGKSVLVAGTDSRIYVYRSSLLDAGPERILGGHASRSFYVKASFNWSGDMIVSGSEDSKAYIWDLNRQAPSQPAVESHFLTLVGHRGGELSDVSWSKTDAFRIATVSDDTTVRVWTATDGAEQEGCTGSAQVNRCSETLPYPVPVEMKQEICPMSSRQTTITSFFSCGRDSQRVSVK